MRATSSRHATSSGQARHSTISACSSRRALGPHWAPTMRRPLPRTGEAEGSAAARSATPTAARAAARHLLHGAARTEPALRLFAAVRLVDEGGAEPAAAFGGPAVLRLVHHQRATAEVLPVELRDRLLRLLGVFQVDEGETARAARLAIGHDLDGGHVASFSLHERADLLLGRVERQVSHVEAVAHVHLLRARCTAFAGGPRDESILVASSGHRMADKTPAVRLRSAIKRYGNFTALDGVSLDIRRGEVFGLLGPNGAGKTTLISLVAGIARPTAGRIEVLGHDVVREYRLTRRAVGLVPQEINFDPFFTVEETLSFQAGYFGIHLTEERLVELLSALGLLEKRRANTRALSGGMKRRLLIAKALVHRPPVLFLDEPTAGVDVELRRDLWVYVRKLSGQGTTIVLTTHYLEEAEELANRIGVIKNGRLLVVEDKQALLARYGKRTVRLRLQEPMPEVPQRLLAAGAELHDEGRSLVLSAGAGQSLVAPLRAVASEGLLVDDVQTREPRLESVIIELLRDHDSAHSAPAIDDVPSHPVPIVPADPIDPTLGVRTLYRKEVKRFLRVPGQTVLSPLITTALYFLVFGYSLGGRLREVDGVPYSRFLVPGLVMLSLINNSFLNTSSSLFIMKLQGTVVDLLVTPLSYLEILAGFVGAGCTRALLVGD